MADQGRRAAFRRWLLCGPVLCAGMAVMASGGPAAAQDRLPETDRPEPVIPLPPPDADLPEVEEVISRAELADAVPPLPPVGEDDWLDQPLESIAEFERRLAAEEGAAEADPAPLGDVRLADGDPVEELADAPVRDPELAVPLPPLEAFEVDPVEFVEGPDDTQAVTVTYATRIEGLEGPDEEAETSLLGAFNALSALRAGRGEAANLAQVSARLTEDAVLLQRLLASEGWFAAETRTRIERGDAPDRPAATAIITVVPGPRFALGQIDIVAEPTQPPDLIASALALRVGEPIVAARVQGAEARVAVTLTENGYPFAEVGQRDILLDPATAEGVYTLPVTTGPRSAFDGIVTTGELAFGVDHVRTLARFRRDQLYDSRLVDDLRQALVATGLFSTVAVRPEPTEETVPGTDLRYTTIVVEQNAGPPRTLSASAGYATGQGFRVEGSWQHRNLFPPEGALIVTGVAGTQETGASAIFRRSNAGRRDRTFQTGVEALYSTYDAYEAYTGRLFALWSYDSTPIWQKTLTYAFGGQAIATNEQDYDFAAAELVRRTFFIGGLTGQVGFDRSNSLLDPTRGFRLTALVQPEGSLQGSFSPYARAILDGAVYVSPADALVIAGRVRLGTIQGTQRFDIAPSRRLYAGGGGSVRGYGFQQLGPRVILPNPEFDPDDEDNDADPFIYRPIGGRSVNEAALEVRYRFGSFGAVAFVDAGQAYEATTPQFNDLQFGVGVGARYYTNFGPLRLDVATPLNRRPGDSRINIYVSIGQAF
ncbi:hypothetical protein EYB45_02580 [Erythrobacteraceae bacterium CFH 75059]|uniref:autotransporter assembly complex protein TamA n=1 Tax=Qipengyuania thermophila TaxID=2509361 RepID=UPI0010220F7E|nr:BamA/TamA family outer membrane protein [Qipengyuania thermophila]TCD06613.1 hypothetical protein EYB45_02580 [Erythrobacteraceae bacterium CFH 75059]